MHSLAIVGGDTNHKQWYEPLIMSKVLGRCCCYSIVGGDANNGPGGSINVVLSTKNGQKGQVKYTCIARYYRVFVGYLRGEIGMKAI